ncbi:TPR repeat-containing protein [Borreliella chilensis]|uniref:TPR repeat-containing protein n=1 Tax=Borreliella chilensis TaxID=1245910 RepID=A0A0A7UV33_9SPIR|nr:TPR repeat-containing protein [Borreliella chilensis]
MKIFLLMLINLFVSCGNESKEKLNLGLRLRELEISGGGSESKIEVYKEFVEKEDKNILKIVNSIDKKARFFNLIGLEFFKLGQYGPSIEYFGKNLEINPNSYLSHFYVGVASYNLAKNLKIKNEIERYMILAENSFLKSISIRNDFKESLFAISNMYVYELDKQLEAKEYLNKLDNMGEDYFEFLMLRGANYYSLGDFGNAILFYDKASKKAVTEEQKEGVSRIMSNLK